MGKHQLGEFEEVVMLTVAILTDEAYGFAIIEEMERRLAAVPGALLHRTLPARRDCRRSWPTGTTRAGSGTSM